MIDFLWSFCLHKSFFDVVRNKFQTISIYTRVIKRRSKAQEKNMS